MNIMLLATAWGPRHGGINAFNRDFAEGLAHSLGTNGRVFCAVLEPSEAERAEAARCGVTLVPVTGKGTAETFDTAWTYEILAWLRKNHGAPSLSWWVGHDMTSGRAALAGPEAAGGGGTALINHMSYIEYQGAKHDRASDADAKHRQQKEMFSDADARLFAVGPLLRDACRRLCGRTSVMLVPGFPRLPPLRPPEDQLVGITFGRMDRASDRIKQGQLAVAGFGKAARLADDNPVRLPCLDAPRLSVIGLGANDRQEELELCALAEQHAGRMINVLPLPYDENRDALFERLAEANLALMLSWHEGFGLTGWEAIAAELPLIISERSGLYKLINETLPGSGPGCLFPLRIDGQRGTDGQPNYTPADLDRVSKAILTIAGDLTKRRAAARSLKEQLVSKLGCTWENTARQFLDGLGDGPGGYRDQLEPRTNAPDGPTSRGNGPTQADDDPRFKALKADIVDALKSSDKAMAALELAMGLTASGARSGDGAARATALVEALTKAPADQGITWLLDAHKKAVGGDGADAIVEASRRLIPYLYISNHDLDIERFRECEIGDVVALPVGLTTFGEIVMAGIERRAAEFEWPNQGIPLAPLAVNVQPETGRMDLVEENIRNDLFKRVDVHPDFTIKSPAQKDAAINDGLLACVDAGKRVYWICNMPYDENDKLERREKIKKIAATYKAMLVAETVDDLSIYHQNLFRKIRDLLRVSQS